MEKKMTYVMALDVVLNGGEVTAEVREKLMALKTSVEKKNSAERKPTATQVANASLKEAMLDFMEVGKAYTVTDVMKGCEAVADLSNQRVSALMRQLVESGAVVREEVKRKAYFSKVEA